MMPVHDISSPRAPSAYHRAMLAYHAFQLQQADEKHEEKSDFLSYWFDRDNAQPSTDPTTYSLDILRGIVLLRNRVVAESRRSFRLRRRESVSVRFVLEVLAVISEQAAFPEAKSYWESVIQDTSDLADPTVSLNELSEAVLAFLGNKTEPCEDVSTRSTSELNSARSYLPPPPRLAWCHCMDPGECLLQ